jgi:tetratricopeptide (TPR) repeat protein
MELGRIQWANGECDAAIAAWTKASSLEKPVADLVNFELGQAWYTKGQKKVGLELLKASRADSYFYTRSLTEQQAGNIEAAQNLLELALEITPKPEYAETLASLYQAQNQTELAIKVWTQLEQGTTEQDVMHWLASGEVAKLEQNWVDAQQALKQAIRLSPNSYDLYLQLDAVLGQTKDWAGVITTSQQAIQLSPYKSPEPYENAANAELAQNDYNAALKWYDAAAAAFPTDPGPDVKAGQAAEKMGYLPEAEQRYLKALKKGSDHFEAILDLSLLKYKQGNTQQALMYLEQIASSHNCAVLNMLKTWYNEMQNANKTAYYTNEIASICKN